jgi:hypothetical protein
MVHDKESQSMCNTFAPGSVPKKRILMSWTKSMMEIYGADDLVEHVALTVDNYEAMCLLPPVKGAKEALLLLVNDDNADVTQIGTQFVLLALHLGPESSSDLSKLLLIFFVPVGLALVVGLVCAVRHVCAKKDVERRRGNTGKYSNILEDVVDGDDFVDHMVDTGQDQDHEAIEL